MVSVSKTEIIEALFHNAGLDLTEFVDLFRQWKSLGPSGEDEFYEFGKDGAYVSPSVNGQKNVLRHVHLVPIIDVQKKADWDKKWERHSRRTSDRALVYVADGNAKFLLITILPEPSAHAIGKMQTTEHKEMMEFFAEIADQFIHHNNIIA